LTDEIDRLLLQNNDRRIRIVTDILSSVLILNPIETAYKFVNKLIELVKQYDAVLLVSLEEGMHPVQTQMAMKQLFDGVIEFSFHKTGLRILSLLRIEKMQGMTPRHDYHVITLSRSGIQIRQADLDSELASISISSEATEGTSNKPLSTTAFTRPENKLVFDYLLNAFVEDYRTNKLSVEQAGWRTRVTVAEATRLSRESFYGKEGRFGPILKELLSSGLVETRFFEGQRGRGGEVVKIRIAYEKELVKRIVETETRNGGIPK